MGDTRGEHWHFYATDLEPGRRYALSLADSRGRALAQPWEIATFPGPDERPQKFRVLFYTCAGGHEALNFLPTAVRNRLLRRGLELCARRGGGKRRSRLLGSTRAGRTARLSPRPRPRSCRGNSTARRPCSAATTRPCSSASATPRSPRSIRPISVRPRCFSSRTTTITSTMTRRPTRSSRSRPPSSWCSSPALRRTSIIRSSCRTSPAPWACRGPRWATASAASPRVSARSATGGSPRFSSTTSGAPSTLAGPSAVYVDLEVEKWLRARTAATEVTHLVHAPSNPPGWTAGKWGEWYPDVLDADGKLTVAKPKPYWQSGWLKQHDRLIAAMSAMKGRIPLVISGDMHAIAIGRMLRSGTLDLKANPVNAVLSGPIGTRPAGWPSERRGIGAQPALHLDLVEAGQADRAARLHHRRLHARQDRAAVLQVGFEDPAGRKRSTRSSRSTRPNSRARPNLGKAAIYRD